MTRIKIIVLNICVRSLDLVNILLLGIEFLFYKKLTVYMVIYHTNSVSMCHGG